MRKQYSISDLACILGGGTPKTTNSAYWNGDIPWLSVVDFNNDFRHVYVTEKNITEEGLKNSSTQILFPGDIIISARGTVGALAQVGREMAFNQSCYGLRAKPKKTTNDYLYYLLKNSVATIKKQTHGSVFDTITRDSFDAITVTLPPLAEQKRIVALLSQLDDKIELNAQINHNLEEQAKAIFKSWFVDFSAIGDTPILDIDNFSCPQGWSISSLAEIANYLNGLAMQKYRPNEDDPGYPVLKIKELRQGICDLDSERCSSEIQSEYIVHDGDVIFSWSGSLLVDFWCGGDCGLNQHLFKVTSTNFNKWFFYSWTQHHLSEFIAIAADKATTMGHIKRENLQAAKVLVPPREIYKKIGLLLAPIYDAIIQNRIESKKLAQFRDMILPKLMSGEIDVSEVEI